MHTGPGRDVDDQAVALRPHRRQHRAHGVEGAVEVDADHVAPAFHGLVLPEAVGVVQPGAVDQDVDAAVARQDARGDLVHRVGIGHVQRLDLDPAAGGGDLVGLGLQHVGTAARHHHRGTSRGQGLRAGQADAGAGAGDPGQLAVQRAHGVVSWVFCAVASTVSSQRFRSVISCGQTECSIG